MSSLVNPSQIEKIVGVPRHKTKHIARAVDDEMTVYVLHSKQCVRDIADLRDCPYSTALDRGIEPKHWPFTARDQPVPVKVSRDGFLVPSKRPH